MMPRTRRALRGSAGSSRAACAEARSSCTAGAVALRRRPTWGIAPRAHGTISFTACAFDRIVGPALRLHGAARAGARRPAAPAPLRRSWCSRAAQDCRSAPPVWAASDWGLVEQRPRRSIMPAGRIRTAARRSRRRRAAGSSLARPPAPRCDDLQILASWASVMRTGSPAPPGAPRGRASTVQRRIALVAALLRADEPRSLPQGPSKVRCAGTASAWSSPLTERWMRADDLTPVLSKAAATQLLARAASIIHSPPASGEVGDQRSMKARWSPARTAAAAESWRARAPENPPR